MMRRLLPLLLALPCALAQAAPTPRFPAGSVVVVDGTTGEVSLVDQQRGAA